MCMCMSLCLLLIICECTVTVSFCLYVHPGVHTVLYLRRRVLYNAGSAEAETLNNAARRAGRPLLHLLRQVGRNADDALC